MRPFRLTPALRDYDWGTRDFIPALIGVPEGPRPCAEAWYGAHPSAPSLADVDGERVPLDALLAQRPELLGPRVGAEFGKLPFLLKLLSAAQPLSIQVHPSRGQAQRGHAARGYPDDSHKPELFVALTEFRALCGFRDSEDITAALKELPELAQLLPALDGSAHALRQLVAAYFALDTSKRDAALLAWLARLEAEAPGPGALAHWVLVAHRTFSAPGKADPGLFFFVLLHFLTLAPGQGLFLPAGVPHAYLLGSGVEVMASSDNVLRCGLTHKAVDVPELLAVTRFESSPPWLVTGPEVYTTAAEEFELSLSTLDAARPHALATTGPEIWLTLDAAAPLTLESGHDRLELSRGAACFVPAGLGVKLQGAGTARVARVRVPERRRPSFRGRVPTELAFGTSGLRGLVTDITDLEAYVNARGFLDYVVESGDAGPGSSLALGGDLRPSTESPGRSILRAVAKAARDAGFVVDYLGKLPTPALTSYALTRGIASVMVTGSHIPFDRNGIKFNKSTGEVLKADEAPILACVREVRRRLYATPRTASPFDDEGMLGASEPLPAENPAGLEEYLARYTHWFGPGALAGLDIGVYQHSAVGRDALVTLLERLGARVLPFGRSETFVAIDTEAVKEEQLDALQRQVDALSPAGPLHAVVSTDGDSDRPLFLAVDDGKLAFISGDRLGIATAEALGARALAVPVSATDAIEQHFVPRGVEVARTRIGSPHVIAKMQELTGPAVVGWEANGGFLLGSTLKADGRTLTALPTRDAFLPICAVLALAREEALARAEAVVVSRLFAALPARYTAADLLDGVAPEDSRAVQRWFAPRDASVVAARFAAEGAAVQREVEWSDATGVWQPAEGALLDELDRLRRDLERNFAEERVVERLDFLDGTRVFFRDGDIAHVRASGNAPQMRMYAVASRPERAQAIARQGVAPGGTLMALILTARSGLRVEQIERNIAETEALFARRGAAPVVGCVCGSEAAQRFWQRRLADLRERWGAERVLALHEDLPVNQAFGLLLAWQRTRPELAPGQGALLSFVFGEGTRSTPFTETDNGQKPAMASFVRAGSGQARYLPMAELALRHFALVEAHLRRSGFDGLVVKWGDEVQISSHDLSTENPLFEDADVVRFVSLRRMNDDEARNKDWVGVDAAGRVTAFIPRRPLGEMQALADRGLLRREGNTLIGGVNLGSIAVSRRLLDALLAEFERDVNDPGANRRERPDLDPQFFTALCIACIENDAERAHAWRTARSETPSLEALEGGRLDLFRRLEQVVARFREQHGTSPRIVAMDFGEPYWGDIGQHRQIREFYRALLDPGPEGDIARALGGLPAAPDAHGNRIVNSKLPEGAVLRNSVLLDCEITHTCDLDGCVLVGTRAREVRGRDAFDVDSAVGTLELAPGAGSYRVVDPGTVRVAPSQRMTSLFLAPLGEPPLHLVVDENTDLRQRKEQYDVPILGNAISFAEAHARASALDPDELARRRDAAIGRVLGRG